MKKLSLGLLMGELEDHGILAKRAISDGHLLSHVRFDDPPGAGDDPPKDDPPQGDPPTGDPAPPADPTKEDPKPEGDPIDWQARYNGLNKKYQETVTEHQKSLTTTQTALGAAEAELAEAKKSLADGETSGKKATDRIKSLTEQVEELTGKVGTLTSGKERSDMILKDYPELAAFEANGLLGDPPEGTEMKDHLDTWKDALGAATSKTLTEMMKGATPPGGGPKGEGDPISAMSNDDLYARIMSLAGSQDPKEQAEYNKLMPIWMERSSKTENKK